MADPTDEEAIEMIKDVTKRKLKLVLASFENIIKEGQVLQYNIFLLKICYIARPDPLRKRRGKYCLLRSPKEHRIFYLRIFQNGTISKI